MCACKVDARLVESVLLSCHSASGAEMRRWLREKLLPAHSDADAGGRGSYDKKMHVALEAY